jgi:hypothetical protein
MIKIKIILTAFIVLYTTCACSQLIGGYGIKAGVVINGMRSSGNPTSNLEDSSFAFNLFSYDVGLYTELFPSKIFNLTAELHYTVLGEHPSNLVRLLQRVPSNQGEFYEYKYASNRFSYISFQLLPHYNFLNTKEDRLFILAGPRFDIMLGNYNSEYENSAVVNNGNLEMGAIIGIGGEFRNIFNFDFRYNYNFTEVYSLIQGAGAVLRKHHSFIFLTGINFKKLLKM